MNFKSVQEKLAQARIQAASAAKKLSLNEMAKQDEYIHSEGLNVGGGSSNNAKSKSRARVANKKEMSILDEVDAVNASFDESIGGGGSRTNTVERSFGMTMNRDGGSSCSDDGDDDSIDSFDPDKDPLLQMAYKSSEKVHQRPSDRGHCENQKNKNQKDPNRFMADLDARLSSPNEPPPSISTTDSAKDDKIVDTNSLVTPTNRQQQQQQQQQSGATLFESFSSSANKMKWLRNVASPKIQESLNNVMKQVPGGIGSKYEEVNRNDENNDIEMGTTTNPKKKVIKTQNGENIHVVSSSSLALGDAENAELERLNQLMNKSNNNVIMNFLRHIEKNRYYLFIVLTFILTTFGYLYTRKKTDESVT